ncbi:MAG: alpha/beta hydrolase [Alphaproteobacteria bacterium]|nr:alpha/beta hydrolase [Alphaproteobacteria bacterium]
MRALIFAIAMLAATATSAAPQWMTLPPTPTLPAPDKSGLVPVNGVKLWYAEFGRGEPVLFVHGGLGNSDYWAHQVRALRDKYRVIVMDSRGHGRSSRNAQPFGYDLMASDVIGLLDTLKIRKVALVGWSDGAIVGLDIAMHHPERLSKLFAFAANIDPTGVSDIRHSPVFTAFIARAGKEYGRLSPTPRQYDKFVAQITRMWNTQPRWTKADFARIRTPTWIVDGDHDEAINHDQPRTMADWTPGAGLLIEPDVSHFAFLQDPERFNRDLVHFLERR